MLEHRKTFWAGWRERIRASRNIAPLVENRVRDSGRAVVAGNVCRLLAALIPVSMLAVSKRILDAVQASSAASRCRPSSGPGRCGVRARRFGALLGRAIGYFDALLADRFTRHVSVRVMEHASQLDLASYEDPVFYDKLERARVQATDRIAMIQAMGAILQQVIAAVSLSAGSLLVLALAAAAARRCGRAGIPGRKPLRVSRLFAEHQPDAVPPAARLSARPRRQQGIRKGTEALRAQRTSLRASTPALERHLRSERALARRRLWAGAALSLLSSAGYYGAYAYVVYRTVTGESDVGHAAVPRRAPSPGASTNLQTIFCHLLQHRRPVAVPHRPGGRFFKVEPTVQSKPNALPAPRPIRDGFEFRERLLSRIPGTSRRVLEQPRSPDRSPASGSRSSARTARARPPSSSCSRASTIRFRRTAFCSTASTCASTTLKICIERDRRDLPGLHALRNDGAAEHRRRPDRRRSQRQRRVRREQEPRGCRDRAITGSATNSCWGVVSKAASICPAASGRKIALARAYLRDAQLLILDEPTAALDARSEYEVFQRFAELTRRQDGSV